MLNMNESESKFEGTDCAIRSGKPALAECAMVLASTLLLGCEVRGKFDEHEYSADIDSLPLHIADRPPSRTDAR
jgi:hypothetical protein